MKPFYSGLVLACLGVIISAVLKDWSFIYKISGIIGLITIILAGLSSWVLADGERSRINPNSEIMIDKKGQLNSSTKILLVGLPNILIAILAYFL
ncbi:DUF5316 family protein [Bacillus sp. FSL K6-3431]|uniref:DUF5316 family protein n=1 Tax=Bacillus sp. FSL K6-3431 TaxID=2921500 RepID=UPI0030F5781E